MGLLIKLCIVFQLIVKETESAVSLNLDTSGTGGYELRFGKSVRLNCTLTGSTCCPEARRWLIRSGGTFSSIINDGVSTDASKYEEDLQEASNQFNLIIKNFDIADVNLEYQCQYQFSTNEYTIQMSDGLIYIPTTNDINVISSDFQMTTFSYSVNITSVYPQPNCSCIYDGDDLTAQMTTTVGDNGVLKYAVLNLSNIAHTCSGEFRITCSIGSYNDQQIATTTPCPETTTEEPPSTTEQSTLGSSIISTASSHSTTIGSGKNPTETVSIISTDNQFTSTNALVVSENKSVLVPLVISISVVSFCLVVISIVVICIKYHIRHESRNKMSDDFVELSFNKRHFNQVKKLSDQSSYDYEKEFLPRSKYNQRSPELSSDIYNRTIWNFQQNRYENDSYRVYNGVERGRQNIQMEYLTSAYYGNEENIHDRQQRQMNIPIDYRVSDGPHRYPQDRCYSHPS